MNLLELAITEHNQWVLGISESHNKHKPRYEEVGWRTSRRLWNDTPGDNNKCCRVINYVSNRIKGSNCFSFFKGWGHKVISGPFVRRKKKKVTFK